MAAKESSGRAAGHLDAAAAAGGAVCLAPGVLAASSREARADDLLVRSPKQVVWIGREPVLFTAIVRICQSGAAEGQAEFEFPDVSSTTAEEAEVRRVRTGPVFLCDPLRPPRYLERVHSAGYSLMPGII